jgi:hypothetical protein
MDIVLSMYINTESTTQRVQNWGFWGFTIFGKGCIRPCSHYPYEAFCAKFYGKPNGEIRNVLASIVFKLFNKN